MHERSTSFPRSDLVASDRQCLAPCAPSRRSVPGFQAKRWRNSKLWPPPAWCGSLQNLWTGSLSSYPNPIERICDTAADEGNGSSKQGVGDWEKPVGVSAERSSEFV